MALHWDRANFWRILLLDIATRRKQLGISQREMAATLGVTRQTLSNIERGDENPKVGLALGIARILSSTVEEVFGVGSPALETNPVDGPAAWGEINGLKKFRAMPKGVLDSAWQIPNARLSQSGDYQASESGALFFDGCDPILGAIVNFLSHRIPVSCLWWSVQNSEALARVRGGDSHFGLIHLPFGRHPQLGAFPGYLTLEVASWNLVMVTKDGNPNHLRRLEDIFRPTVNFAYRSIGSGVREYTDELANRFGVTPNPELSFDSHISATNAVRFGIYDASLVAESVARLCGASFITLDRQTSWLVVPSSSLDDLDVSRALEEIHGGDFRKLLSGVPGYAVAA
ncbi:substrate-binding domain-containing protein [Acidithrix sp. C25]|uniref:substrate-binding domain-containing protein n=1 Tax=Acidithrix sp. C25 TaxID=1671482 RepID=UPI0009E58C76|nr:substrate-binding domain-containing protein [Acidithrix sp. C25]